MGLVLRRRPRPAWEHAGFCVSLVSGKGGALRPVRETRSLALVARTCGSFGLREGTSVDFSQLECFVRAYELGSFSKAAAELYLAQTSFTYRITSLERELGCRLFARSKRGVVPTDAARTVYEDALALLDQRRRLVEHLRAGTKQGGRAIRVGFNRYPNTQAFFSAIERFRAAHPDLRVETDFEYLDDPASALEAGTHDVVLVFDYEGRSYGGPLKFVELGSTPYYVTMSATHPLANRSALELADLSGQTLLTLKRFVSTPFQVPSVEEARRVGITIDATIGDNESLLLAIRTGTGIGVYPMPGPDSPPGFARRPLLGYPPLRYGLLFARKGLTPEVRELVDLAVQTMRPHGADQDPEPTRDAGARS